MRILVTGGAGFIGSHIVDRYLAEGHDVLVLDSLWEHGGGRRANVPDRASFVHMDIRDENVGRIFTEFKPEIVSHHAAQHSVAISSRDPVYDAEVNVLGLLNILEQLGQGRRQEGHLRLERCDVRQSRAFSDHRFDAAEPDLALRHHEDGRRALPSLLSKPKRDSTSPRCATATSSVRARIRTAKPASSRSSSASFCSAKACASTGTASRRATTCTSKDVAECNTAALTRGSGGCYVIGTGIKTSVNGIYRALVQISGFEAPITAGPKRPGDPRDAQFDSAGAKKVLEWEPVTKLIDGMTETYEYFKLA